MTNEREDKFPKVFITVQTSILDINEHSAKIELIDGNFIQSTFMELPQLILWVLDFYKSQILPLFSQLLSEEEVLDFLDTWGYRNGNMLKCNDDDFRKISKAISIHFCKPKINVSECKCPLKNKEPIYYTCTLEKFAEQLNVPLYKAMEFGKYFQAKFKFCGL